MLKDIGLSYTDKRTKRLEKRLREVYEQAEKDIEAKMDDFNRRYLTKYKIHQQEVKDGKITQDDFDRWLKGQVFQGKQWTAKKEQIARTLADANRTAVKMVNDEKMNVFTFNSNYQAYQLEHGAGVNFGFNLYDAKTVENLIKNEPTLLPMKKLDLSKDIPWNMKNITREVAQGIIQGESLDDIAKRLAVETGSTNYKAMVRTARTAMTGAQNSGRNIRLQDAKSMGINVMKEWMATLDGRTRDSHRSMDGEKITVGDKWHHYKFSNGCEYPGDPNGPPREVYNCRCTLVGDVVDYPSMYERYDNINGKPIDGMTYRQWEDAKKGIGVNSANLVYGSTIKILTPSGTHWVMLTKEDNTEFKGDDVVYPYTKTIRDADVYTTDDGFRILVPTDVDHLEQSLSYRAVIRELYAIPEEFRSVIQKEIHIVDYDNPDDPYWRKIYNNFTRSYATNGGILTFYKGTKHNIQGIRDTLCHEGGHNFDHINGDISNSSEWINAVHDDLLLCGWGSVTKYGSNAMAEDFAESCMMYYSGDRKNKKMMENQFPNRIKVIKKYLKKKT